MKPLVLYHANCWDGFCAAWVARKKLGDIEAVPVQYGTPPPDVTGRDVYILDFSYKLPVMRQILDRAAYVLVLDHHKTAEEELTVLMSEDAQAIRSITFDMNKSGGRLSWEHFFPGQDSPWLVDYTEDRDLWRWSLPDSRAVNANLRSYPLDFAKWDELHSGSTWVELVSAGEAILRREQQIVTDHIRHAREITLDGHSIRAVNATTMFSEIAGELAKGRPFGATYFQRQDGKRQWSLRSDENGVDVSAIAKAHGGGGHVRAAGFEEAPQLV